MNVSYSLPQDHEDTVGFHKISEFIVEAFWQICWFAFFVMLPICITIALTWGLHKSNVDDVLDSPWLLPGILAVSSFLSGVVTGAKVSGKRNALAFLMLGHLAMLTFGIIAWIDMEILQVYSQFLPPVKDDLVAPVSFSLPAFGIIGMVFFRYFMVRDELN